MSRRTFSRFEYFDPKTLKEAVSFLSKYREKAEVLAGGTDVFVLIRNGAISPECIIDISKIPKMSYVKEDENGLKIGALTTIREIEISPTIQEKYTSLHEAARSIGSVQIRNMATVGGNLCRASPSADMACPLLALDAELSLKNSEETRKVRLEDFLVGPDQTVLKVNELLTEIRVQRLSQNTGTAFIKIARTAMDLATVNVAVTLTLAEGVCKNAKIALGAVASTPIRAKKAEKAVSGKIMDEKTIEEAAKIASEETKPITDVRSTAQYRKTASEVLVKRAIKTALGRIR